eukprot:scaffold362_cov246-Pinguiococcus_pyrenoidosus.AAC.15
MPLNTLFQITSKTDFLDASSRSPFANCRLLNLSIAALLERRDRRTRSLELSWAFFPSAAAPLSRNMALSVAHRGQEVLREDKQAVSSLAALCDSLAKRLDLAPESLKLLYQGRRVRDASFAAMLQQPEDASLVLLGSTTAEMQTLRRAEAKADKIRRMEEQRAANPGVFVQNSAASAPRVYGFGALVPLAGLPDVARAQRILEELATDPGVLRVMEKYQWQVGELCEMYPEGQVGVSEVCVLGLNENKGQRIRLRLRTDDLQGFRKLLNIRNVLFHELAHNVHGDHDDKFYMLMREIEREANALDWRRSAGYTADGRRVRPTDREVLGLDRAAGSHVAEGNRMRIRDLSRVNRDRPGASAGGTHVLGRREDAPNASDASLDAPPAPARSMAALAAAERHQQTRTRELSPGRPTTHSEGPAKTPSHTPGDFGGACSCLQCEVGYEEKSTPPPQHLSPGQGQQAAAGDEAKPTLRVAEGDDDGERMDIEGGVEAAPEIQPQARHPEEPAREGDSKLADEAEEAAEAAAAAATAEEQLLLQESLQGMGPAGERLQKTIADLAVAQGSADSQRRQAAAQLILKVFSNILENLSEEKFQSIRATSRAFQSRIASVSNAPEVLFAAGFDWDGEGLDRKLMWKRKDVALLWAGKALLEASMA